MYNLIDIRKNESKLKEMNLYLNTLILFLFSITIYSYCVAFTPKYFIKQNIRVNWLTIGLISNLIAGGLSKVRLPKIEEKIEELEKDSNTHEQNNRHLIMSSSNYYLEQELSKVLNPPQPQQQDPFMAQLMQQAMSIPIVGETQNDEIKIEPEKVADRPASDSEQLPFETAGVTLFDWNNFKNGDEFPNIAVIGKPGSGKSTLGQWLSAMFGGLTVAIAPHYQTGDFPTADIICGKGRNYGTEIEKEPLIPFNELLTGKHNLSCLGMIKSIHNEMTRRYQLPDYSNCEAITLILDEYNSYACKKGLSEYIGELLREARKVNIRLIFLCHQTNVKSWGIEGNGDIRKSINQVNLVSHALELAKTSLNNCKINSNNYYYWSEVIEVLKANKRACLVDDYLAEIPDLTNWLATPNPNQLVLGIENTTHGTAHTAQSRNTLPLWEDTRNTWEEVEVLERVFNLDTDTEHCPKCDSINVKNNGKTSAGKPRKRCNDCGVTWSL